jgi:hypothetical protein
VTVSSQTPINRSTGNGVTTVFPYGFKIISEADIEVTVDGVAKTLNVDYTVSGVGNEAGGNVTMTAAPANLSSVVRRRNMALVRTTDYQDQGEMPAATLDSDFDAAVLMIQQVDEQIGRAVTVPAGVSGFDGQLPDPVSSMFLRINSAADGFDLVSEVTPGALTVTPFIETLLNDTDATAARSTLGAQVAGSYQAAGSYAASGANNDITSLTGLTSPVSEVRQLQPITAAIASNAITITPSALSLEFRNTTLTNGAVSFVEGTPAALVIASTDSFGLVTAAGNQRIAILAINNAGTIELAASALAGGVSLDETGVITTATAATLGTHIKAANVRTGVAYRVIGFVDATFTTATGWGSLALVQGTGGQALAAMSSLGYGARGASPGRALNTTYYNTTSRPMFVEIIFTGHAVSAGATLVVDGSTRQSNFSPASSQAGLTICTIVGPNSSYAANTSGSVSLTSWKETT